MYCKVSRTWFCSDKNDEEGNRDGFRELAHHFNASFKEVKAALLECSTRQDYLFTIGQNRRGVHVHKHTSPMSTPSLIRGSIVVRDVASAVPELELFADAGFSASSKRTT